jgi:MFS family permease
VQSGTSALMVAIGGVFGGYLARHATDISESLAEFWQPGSALFVVFVSTSVIRALVVACFVPILKEPEIRKRPRLLDVILRVARINAISGVALDWMSVTRKDVSTDEPEDRE